MHLLASLFLLLSGIATLTYQVTWVRLLGFSMGSTSASISTVLTAFFIGMALGSYLAQKITRNHIQSFTPYIILEALIGLTGLLLLPILLNLDALIAIFPTLGSLLPFKFILSLCLLLVPTLCIGATFPVIANLLIRHQQTIGLRISQLYGLNTLGAVLGALAAGFIFIPSVGLDGAIYIAVTLNFLIVLIALVFNRYITFPAADDLTTAIDTAAISHPPPLANTEITSRSIQQIALLVLIVTGFISIATQVAWTKYLSIFTGTTIYGFAIILAIFLFGIAAGSWYVRAHLEKFKQPIVFMGLALILLSFLLLVTRTGLSLIPAIYEGINAVSILDTYKQWMKYLFVFLLLFPPTFVLGAIFPLSLKLYCGNLSGIKNHLGKAYAINTIASVGGSLAAGFWLIPHYGTDTTLVIMAVIVALVAFVLVLRGPSLFFRTSTSALIIGVLICSAWFPAINYETLISSVSYQFDNNAVRGQKPKFLFLEEGKSSVISLITYDDQIAKFQSNGLNESLIDMDNPNNSLIIESLLAYMPYFLHKDPKSAFIVGFGGGITTRAFTHTALESIHVVELEPAIVKAGKMLPNGPITALNDPRVTIEFNDARNTLLTNNNHYDLIASQPSHPWLAGAANVFTEDFFEIVYAHLNDGGIYSQWINLFRMDVTTLKSIFKAFFNVFPHGFSLANLETGDFMLIGSKNKLIFDFEAIEQKMQSPGIKSTLAQQNIYKPTDILWYFALSHAEITQASSDSVANKDTNILSEVRLSALLQTPAEEENPYFFLRNQYHFDLTSYLKLEEATSRYYDIALFFLFWKQPVVAEKISRQLYKIDPAWGLALQHEILWWKHNFKQATNLYENSTTLLDKTHFLQAQLFIEQGNISDASASINRMSDEKSRRAGQAYLMYAQKQWQPLSQLNPQSQPEKIWHLLGLAQLDLTAAPKELIKIVDDDNNNFALLRTLITYYGITHNTIEMNHWVKRLQTRLDEKLSRYIELADIALEQGDDHWAHELISAIEGIDPSSEELTAIKNRLQDR